MPSNTTKPSVRDAALPDDRLPDTARQQSLRDAIRANVDSGRLSFEGIRLYTRGEVNWLSEYRNQSTSDALESGGAATAAVADVPLDLRGAILQGAILGDVDLHGCDLRTADLSLCDLSSANVRGAFLGGANLQSAIVYNADLSDSEMDTRTNLKNMKLNTHTLLGDIKWNDVNVTRILWGAVPRLGDEDDVFRRQSRREYIAACRYAARAYRNLSILLRSQGLLEPASRYRIRQQQFDRRAYLAEGRVLSWAGSLVLDVVSGYGERPARIFVTYLAVVSLFAFIYWWVENVVTSATNHLLWYEAVVLSLSSFHGRGFFPQTISLGDPVAIAASIEAVIGLFIELILIATFSRRFLGN